MPRAGMPEPAKECEREELPESHRFGRPSDVVGWPSVPDPARTVVRKGTWRPYQDVGAWMWVSRRGLMDVWDMDLAGSVSVFTWSSISPLSHAACGVGGWLVDWGIPGSGSQFCRRFACGALPARSVRGTRGCSLGMFWGRVPQVARCPVAPCFSITEGDGLCVTALNSAKSITYNTRLVQRIIGGSPALWRPFDGVKPLNSSLSGGSQAVRHLCVDEESAGQRLDNFLFRELKGVPKTHIYRIIRSGEVRRNKGRISADDRVQAGDVLRIPPIRLSERVQEKAAAVVPARTFPVLYEDDAFLAVDKPAGVAVHGGSGVSFGVIEQLRRARPQARYLELVHRLDRETSGILLIAKKKSALNALQDQFRQRETGKTYLTLVKGTWPARLKVLDQPLHKYLLADGERRVRVVDADHPDGLRSISLVQSRGVVKTPPEIEVNYPKGFTLLEVTIKTGRTHQIRVHLSHAGHSIAGDDKYGDFELNRELARVGLRRMFLHAWRLRLTHPISGEAIELHSELPAELKPWADQ